MTVLVKAPNKHASRPQQADARMTAESWQLDVTCVSDSSSASVEHAEMIDTLKESSLTESADVSARTIKRDLEL
jgi:hypothetical protein